MDLRICAPLLLTAVIGLGQGHDWTNWDELTSNPEWIKDQMALRNGADPTTLGLPPPFGTNAGGGFGAVSTLQITVMPTDDDVVPINGDGAGPTDEVMTPPDGYRPIGFIAPATFAPFIVGVMHGNNRVDFRVISPSGLSAAQWRAVGSRSLVLEPLSHESAASVERAMAPLLQRGSGAHVARLQSRVYCAEAQKKGPPEGTVFVVADRAAQAQFQPAQLTLRVARRAAKRNLLAAQGDPSAYAESITQYAVWTRLEHWDESRFTGEFVKRTKEAFVPRRTAWTRDTEEVARIAARYRWADVQRVIATADAVDHQLATAGSTGGAR